MLVLLDFFKCERCIGALKLTVLCDSGQNLEQSLMGGENMDKDSWSV